MRIDLEGEDDSGPVRVPTDDVESNEKSRWRGLYFLKLAGELEMELEGEGVSSRDDESVDEVEVEVVGDPAKTGEELGFVSLEFPGLVNSCGSGIVLPRSRDRERE